MVFQILTAQEPIPLYNGAAPGSEQWNWEEKIIETPQGKFISDVSEPVLLPFPATDPNGTAVVIAPGGAFHILAMEHEGVDVAKRTNRLVNG